MNSLLNKCLYTGWHWLAVGAAQSQGPKGPVVAEAAPADEDPG